MNRPLRGVRERADQRVCSRIPNARPGRAGLSNTVTPIHLPMREGGSAIYGALRDGREVACGKADRFFIAVGVVNTDSPIWRVP